MIATFASVPSPLPAGSGCSQCMRAFRHLSGMSSPSAGSLRAPSGGGAVVNVVSYNVLSDSLCNAKSYPCMDPEHLLPEPRLELVKAKVSVRYGAHCLHGRHAAHSPTFPLCAVLPCSCARKWKSTSR